MRIKKPVRVSDRIKVVYDEARWRLLDELRRRAISIMEALERHGMPAIVHGSVARGDVTPESDIDIFIPAYVPPYKVEIALESAGFSFYARMITQATPWHVIKGHIYLDERTVVTFPMTRMTKLEREFYKFGGELDLEGLKAGRRVPGIDKRLMLIEPKPYGHDEWSILGREAEAARIVGVSIDIIREREYVLLRRDEIGRTGVFIRRVLGPEESFEDVVKELARKHPAVRKRLMEAEWL